MTRILLVGAAALAVLLAASAFTAEMTRATASRHQPSASSNAKTTAKRVKRVAKQQRKASKGPYKNTFGCIPSECAKDPPGTGSAKKKGKYYEMHLENTLVTPVRPQPQKSDGQIKGK